jgi:arsenate reductase (glutaredoxin)
MIIYVYSKCSTCQDALRFLEKQRGKNSFTIKEITVTPPSLKDLQQMLKFQNGNLIKLFNTSGQLYRELCLKDKLDQMPLDQALKLLTENGMLVKRPFLLAEEFGLLGFKEPEWSQHLASGKRIV